jgi:prepilin-type N-terminal cleavage/methylation domain-containing protein
MRIKKGQQGFSIIELIIVMVIITILSTISFLFLRTSKKLLAAEEQAIRLSDVLQEARQKTLTQKEVMRVEINDTRKTIRLIEENDPAIATDDRLIRESAFYTTDQIRYDTNPTNISVVPADSSPVPKCTFSLSTHPLSATESVCTIRFLRNGLVSNAGSDAIGTGAIVGGVTVLIWKPTVAGGNVADVARAVSITGGSANIRMWEYRFTNTAWFDSRGLN